MMRHPDHHHIPPNQIQRDARMGVHRMGPPQNRGQPMLMSMQPPVPVPQSGFHSKMIMFLLMFSYLCQHVEAGFSYDQLVSLFENTGCIEGVLVSMPSGPALITTSTVPQLMPTKPTQPVQQQLNTETLENAPQNTNNVILPTNLANTKEKTPMCLVNELARYNKIQHQYRLTSEQGPAHKKRFTVNLKLDNEEYEAEGPSIKKAQHSAAAEALAKTEFKHPPPKSIRNVRPGMKSGSLGMLTPTVELNALAMKRGERTVYVLETAHPAQNYIGQAPGYYPRHNMYGPQGQPRYNYDARRNHTGRGHYVPYDQRYAYSHYKAHGYPGGEIFTVVLRVGEREYSGEGPSAQAARHNAASKALHDLKQLPTPEDVEEPIKETGPHIENTCQNDLNSELKSPISLVHEIALKRNLSVSFEVLSEKGPPHMKVFVTLCRVGDLVAEGEGNGKKISKKKAAEKMLEELSKLPVLPNVNSLPTHLKRKRVVKKKKTRNLIKVNQDKTAPEYVEDINPISRLIQIQQASKEKEPTYTVLEERGAPRRREFVIEAAVNGHACTGVGPNKKLAKRAAAEALLVQLGYSQPATSPAKPVLKADKETIENNAEKPRKVTFMEEKSETPVGGSGGRQLVPGLLLVNDQSNFQSQQGKQVNIQTTATIAKELLKAGTSPTAEALAKSGQANIKTPPPPTSQGIRSKDQLLYLAQLLGVQVQFSDFPKANHEMYLTLVSLSTTPPQVCHGEGPSTEASHEKAALEALTVLSELGLDNVIPNKKETPAESLNKPQPNPKAALINGIKK